MALLCKKWSYFLRQIDVGSEKSTEVVADGKKGERSEYFWDGVMFWMVLAVWDIQWKRKYEIAVLIRNLRWKWEQRNGGTLYNNFLQLLIVSTSLLWQQQKKNKTKQKTYKICITNSLREPIQTHASDANEVHTIPTEIPF